MRRQDSCADRQCTQVGPNSVDAKIDGLEALPNSLFYSAVPAISHPPGTHYVTASAADKLELLSLYYSVGFFPDIHGPIAITAGSLEWGGLYDIDRDWRPPHIEHRRGTIVDVRANGAAGAIGPANFAKFRSVCRQVNADCKIHSAGTANQHFHVRLFGVAE